MMLDKIRIGMEVKITGTEIRHSNCGKSCGDCMSRRGVTFMVKAIDMNEPPHEEDGRRVNIVYYKDGKPDGNCNFHPDDIEPIKISNWKSMVM